MEVSYDHLDSGEEGGYPSGVLKGSSHYLKR
jgi:hypothetical protein